MRRPVPQFILSDPWCPTDALLEASAQASVISFLSGTPVGTNNIAIYMPVRFPCDATIYKMCFMATNGTGNYDIGLYNGAYAKLTSSGSTAMSAAGLKTHTFSSDIRVTGGDLYYTGFSLSNSAGAAMVASFSTAPPLVGAGFAQESSALPLPATMTPVTMGGNLYPLISFGVR